MWIRSWSSPFSGRLSAPGRTPGRGLILPIPPGNPRPAQPETGSQALEKVKETAVDLMLLDLILPEISGREVLVHLKGEETCRNVPVVVFTGAIETDWAGSEANQAESIGTPGTSGEIPR
ncbi:MAG: two-component system response regulator [Candidatus Methylomirabilales bacterium]